MPCWSCTEPCPVNGRYVGPDERGEPVQLCRSCWQLEDDMQQAEEVERERVERERYEQDCVEHLAAMRGWM